jgi:hypothetical protein
MPARPTIQGNLVGLNLLGTAKIANGQGGCMSQLRARPSAAPAVPATSSRGNAGFGLYVAASTAAAPTTINANYVGTTASGTAALGNSGPGIRSPAPAA